MRHRLLADVHQAHRLFRAPATRVEQTLAVHRLDHEIGDEQFFRERGRPRHQLALGIEHHAATVEHQLVLAAHLVDVGERAAGIGGTRGEHALARVRLAGVERRAVDVDVQLGATGGLLGQRAGGAPDVFADADAHLHPTDDVQLVRVAGVAGREVALFVEHGVVRQQALAVGAQHLATGAHRGGVVEVAIGGDIAHHRSAAPGVSGHLGERGEVVGDEAGFSTRSSGG